MKLKFISVIFCCVIFSPFCFATASDVVPSELVSFVLPGFEVLDFSAGDLNGDGKSDYAVILKHSAENNSAHAEKFGDPKRPLLLLIRQADDTLKQVRRNDNAVLCLACGGMMGDPFQELYVDSKTHSVGLSYYGGSGVRWSLNYTFAYKSNLKEWMLVEESGNSFSATTLSEESRYRIKEEEFLKPISFEQFQYDDDSDYSGAKPLWRVKTQKTFFYDSPELKSKHRKGFLVLGDQCTMLRETKNFIFTVYSSPNFTSTSGYLLKKDLEML